jgi:hypothetical protein
LYLIVLMLVLVSSLVNKLEAASTLH